MLINLYLKEEKKSITISVNEKVDNYGNNVSAWVTQTKEERDNKSARTYVGNGKVVFSKATEYPIAPKQEFKTDDKTPF